MGHIGLLAGYISRWVLGVNGRGVDLDKRRWPVGMSTTIEDTLASVVIEAAGFEREG
jgi:hypothetical protein